MPLLKNGNPTMPASPSALKAFFLASRPKTWIASISPVLIGTTMAPQKDLKLFFLTLIFSLFIQIGTNFANDYFDFINGADTVLRNGPKRATQQGWISPNAMLRGTALVFILAILAAIPLMVTAGLWSIALAALCVAFGILYTGGPKPLGYLGLGEILVFIFFGPIATMGTFFLQTQTITMPLFIASLAPGLLSCSILVANNLRDEKTDRVAGKNTLVVRFGKTFGSWEYTLTLLGALLVPLYFHLVLPSLIFMGAIPLIKRAFRFQDPLELISLLQGSALLLIVYTILFCLVW
jgi:1,4-dihydroxy-2-naphthoate octaprenyltransferase